MNRWIPVTIVILVVAYVAFSLGANQAKTDGEPEASLQETTTLEQDPELLQVARSIGAYDLEGVGLVYADEENKSKKPNGDYSGEGTMAIVVERGLSTQKERTAVAREYMHYIWQQRMSDQQRAFLTSQLLAMYSEDGEDMNSYLSDYLETNTLNVPRLYVKYCTEVDDKFLSEPILASCSSYMNRSSLDMKRT